MERVAYIVMIFRVTDHFIVIIEEPVCGKMNPGILIVIPYIYW